MMSYMQTLWKGLYLGFQMGFIPQHSRALWGFTGKYEIDNNKVFMFEYNQLNPQTKLTLGAIGRPSKKLNIFSLMTMDPTNKTDCVVGFRARFMSAMLTSSISSSGKMTSVYKKPAEPLNTEWTAVVDMSKPQNPVSFGVSLSFGQEM